MFLVVNKAPANIVDPATGSTAVFPETGTYLLPPPTAPRNSK